MGIEMKMSLVQETRLTQEMRLQEILECQLKLIQTLRIALQTEIRSIRQESGVNTAEQLLERAYDDVIQKLPPGSETRTLLSSPEMKSLLITSLLRESDLLLQRKYLEAAVGELYHLQGGAFKFADDGAERRAELPLLIEAFTTPARLTNHLATLRAFKADQHRNDSSADLQGTREEIERVETAQRIAVHPTSQDFVANFSSYLQNLVELKQGSTRPIYDALLEDRLYDAMLIGLSDRVLQRFTESLSVHLTERKLAAMLTKKPFRIPESIQNAYTNTLAEIVLIGLGIIDKSLFTLKSAEVPIFDITTTNFIQHATKKMPQDLLKEFSLASTGTYYFQRYHTLHTAPRATTDDAIRAFATTIVRQDQEVLVAAAEFADKLKDYAESTTSDTRTHKLSQAERKNRFYELISETLSAPELLKLLREKTKAVYIPYLKKQNLV